MTHVKLLCAFVIALAGCKVSGTFACEQSEQCRLGGMTGTCETTGFCSFADPSCPSGQRYDPLAGGGLGGVCVGDEPMIDAGPDAKSDPRCLSWTPTPELFDPCGIPAPLGDLHLTGDKSPYKYNTTTGMLTDNTSAVIAVANIGFSQTGGPDVVLISVENLVIDAGAQLNLVGTKPLIVAAWMGMVVDGTIDGGSHRGGLSGAGSDPADCATGAPTQGGAAVVSGGSGGGGGGAFRGKGGNGGVGDAGGPIPGGTGGVAVGTPTVIRGGCSGAPSGTAGTGAQLPSTATTISEQGVGGGAIRLAAFMGVTISGAILTGGGGGAGAAQGSACGGGGGGAGGYIGVEGATVTLSGAAKLASNGGGGGGSGPFAGLGNPGTDGQPTATAAPGGASVGTCGLAGANGAAAGTLAGPDATGSDSCGGGGGGGSVGYILVRTPMFQPGTSTVSPAAIVTAP